MDGKEKWTEETKNSKNGFPFEAESKSERSNGSTESSQNGQMALPPEIGYFELYRYATTKDKVMLSISLLCSVLTGATAPLSTILFAQLTDAMVGFALQQNPDIPPEMVPDIDFTYEVQLFALRNTYLGVILLVFSYLSVTLSNYAALNQVYTIRRKFLQAALNQDISYYDLNESGDFASRMTNDLLKLEDGIGEKGPICFHFWMSFLGCIILAFTKGWELTLVCLASFPIMLIAVGFVGFTTSKISKQESKLYGIAGSVAEEVLGGIRTVMAFGGEQKEVQRYKANLSDVKSLGVKRNFFTGIGFGILFFCIYATYALSFWYGVGLIIDDPDNYPIDVMVAVFFGVLTGTMNFGMSTQLFEVFGVAKGAGAKIFSVIDNIPIIDPLTDRGFKPAECKGNISFRNVYFDYPSRPDVKILRGLNLDIHVGQTVAIVGESGCGKSTCMQLVQRFYDPFEGSVTLDNNDLRDLSVSWLRKNIGVVGQEPVLFNTTIGENIRYGLETATKDDIEEAARKANAHDFIKTLPLGYDTLVGERGTQLSGGQKQRIAIARALVRNPRILLLDEATSALDNNSEAKVQRALEKASEGRTTIIVAHRLSTIRNADVIVTLSEGRVIEKGSHSELMELKGHYYHLVMAQVGPVELENGFKRQDSKIENADGKRLSINDEKDSYGDDDIVQVSNDDENKDLNLSKDVSFTTILELNSPEWKAIAVACTCSFIMGSAMPVFSILFGDIIGTFALGDEEEMRSTTNFYCLLFVVLGIVAGFSTFLSFSMYGYAGEKMTMRLRGYTFEAMMKQEIGWYDDKSNSTGALCARLSGEASAVQGATGQRIGVILQSVSTLVISISISIYYEWRLGLVASAFLPFTLIAAVLHAKIQASDTHGSSRAMERSTKLAVDVIGSIRTVASLGREKMFLDQFTSELRPALKNARRHTHYRGLVYGLARSIIFFAFSASIYYGGYLMENKNVYYADVLKVSQALIMASFSVADSMTFAPNLQKGIIAATKIINLLNRIPKILDPVRPSQINYVTNGEVTYKDVDFSYPTRPYLQVLKKMGLNVPQGKTVALVGPSGCGKSTCIQLIERFYDPLNGQVFMDKEPINELLLSELRGNLGIVSQEPILFDRTIGENIAYGDNSRIVTEQEIIAAAKKANIHKFIASLPLGYETRLGTKGTQLSGGQKQRVAIARALLRNPRILLLDEATSALDSESEKVVQEALDEAKLGRTCLIIAHRLSTIKDADLIYVFSEGCVAESGTHEELMKRKGLYYRLQTISSKNI